ncbi:3387_t:CDS:2, partial [Entrophospora sp. SA101]
MNSYTSFIILLLNTLFCELTFSQLAVINPYSNVSMPIKEHNALLVSDSIYFFGGCYITCDEPTNQLVKLNVTSSFSTNQPLPLIKFTPNTPPPGFLHAAVQLSSDNKTAYLIGGVRKVKYGTPAYGDLAYSINIHTLDKWEPLIIVGQSAVKIVDETISVIDPQGDVYVHTSGNFFVIYKNLTLTMLTPKPALNLKITTCHLLNEFNIIFLGGNLAQLDVYDTQSNTWSITKPTGVAPSERLGHSSVITHDGRIILYGGTTNLDKLAVLQLDPLQWIIPNVTYPLGTGASHRDSVMVLYKDYVMITFGWIYDVAAITYFQNILLLDIRNNSDGWNYKWMDAFVTPTTPLYTATTTVTATVKVDKKFETNALIVKRLSKKETITR